MKQGSSHRRTVSENQDHSTLGKEAWTTQSTTWAPVVGWRQINITNYKSKRHG